jgi:hypothetical protein
MIRKHIYSFYIGGFFLGVLWVSFTAKLLAWIASTVLRAKVQFRLAGFQRLKDVTINFQKGAVAHLAIGEVRFSVRKQLKAFFGDYKFQLFLSDVEVVLQKPPTTTSKKAKAKLKVSTHRNSASERRKWLIVATLAKYLKFSVTELVFKVLEIPNMSLEIKELDLDLLKEDVGSSLLGLKLSVIPCTLYLGELENWVYNSGITKFGQRLLSVTGASSAPVIDTAPSVLFLMEHLSVACSFDHDREAGVMMQQLEVACGDAMLDLNEELLVSENDPLGASTKPVKNIETAEKQKDEVTVVPLVNPPYSSLEKEEDGVAVDVPPRRVVKVPEKVCCFFSAICF